MDGARDGPVRRPALGRECHVRRLRFARPGPRRPGPSAGTSGFDAACAGFDLAAIPTPDVAVSVTSESDVTAAVRFAADHGLPVAVRATGHGPIPGVDHGLLIDTRALSTVSVDGSRSTATIGAGATWAPVLAACAPLGLAPPCGSAPDVGAVSYTLGGGLGPFGRSHGWAADRVRRLGLVTAAGSLREVTPESDPELFWACRGGGGNFGVVTELEIDLVPAGSLYGGGLFLPGEAAAEILAAFGRCTAEAPDELTLSVAFVTFPDVDPVPPEVRGRFVGHVRVAYLGPLSEAEDLIKPLRAVATPLLDTVRPLAVTEIGTIHADPVLPQPVACGGAILPRWDDAAIAVLVDEVSVSKPHMLELRHLGGALARPPAVSNAVGHRDAYYNLFTSAYPGQTFADAVGLQTALYERLLPWTGGRALYNFAASPGGRPVDARTAFDEPTYSRLRSVKTAWDPDNLFRFCIDIPPLAPARSVSLRERLQEMFTRMVEAKDAALVDTYYDPEFVLTTNGQTQDLEAFRAGHERVYPTPITYRVEYDDSWVESGPRLAARVWITTQRPGEEAHRIEVVLVAEYRDGRLLRVHELTWPDWSQRGAFERYGSDGSQTADEPE
ncbi:FAD-binding protein [Pseudonocardia sp. NPDC049154]|uniref:FAD-binding protein n=1 Tax=Pseudonocardia sp. NPDC049154 TaxID=3155501 RepID=UPI0033C2A8BB